MKKLSWLFLSIAPAILLSGAMLAINHPPGTKASTAAVEPPSQLQKELAQARAATAKYHNINKALEDGYVDIDVFIPNMGFHYLRPALLDATFEADKPELLVYAIHPENNHLRLVAVEYAVPLALSAAPPEGFTGDEDHWHMNEEFGLWTLHAWVWMHNPNGLFAEFNPRVP